MSKNKSINGAFRKKKIYFSQVSNVAIRDKKLSLRAKGLYSLISSYITLEDFTLYKNYLISLSEDGKDSFNRTWDELKGAGYLVQYQVRNDNGQYVYEYELFDEPIELSDEDRAAAEQKEANRIARNKRKQENKKLKEQPQTETPPMEKTTDGVSTTGSATTGESVSLITTDLNNTDVNNTYSKTTTTVVVIPDEIKTQYEQYFGKKPNYSTLKKISTYLDKFEVDAITYSFDRAANKGQDFGYAVGILKNWTNAGTFTFDEVVGCDNSII